MKIGQIGGFQGWRQEVDEDKDNGEPPGKGPYGLSPETFISPPESMTDDECQRDGPQRDPDRLQPQERLRSVVEQVEGGNSNQKRLDVVAQQHVGLFELLDGDVQPEGSIDVGGEAERTAMERVPHRLIGVAQIKGIGAQILVAAQRKWPKDGDVGYHQQSHGDQRGKLPLCPTCRLSHRLSLNSCTSDTGSALPSRPWNSLTKKR